MEVHDFETQHPHKAQVDSQGHYLSKSPPIDVNEQKTLRRFFAMIFFINKKENLSTFNMLIV
jgi:hypothetical protein